MPTLYLSAPRNKDAATALHKNFSTILASGKGPEYAIARRWVTQLKNGMKVVIFNRADQRQAEGLLIAVNLTGQKTPQGILRYDVIIRGLREAPFSNPPAVDRFGVAVG